ncbi:unnamed protein product [marine sediment metagenome]|uniref:Uncharacterized protein n=1 Tax=marine sediment metagenome TaxID=412755 RepID=X1IWA7_9ZZZZ
MALLKMGPVVAAASGKIGGTVFSRNRYGVYARQWVLPTVSTSEDALQQKALLGGISAAFAALTDDQKLQWNEWAQSNPMTNRIGDQQILTGHAAYVRINMRVQKGGIGEIATPPVGVSPLALATITLTVDIGPGEFSFAFAPTPTPAPEALVVQACYVDSTSINFVENLFRTIGYSGGAEASPFDIEAAFVAKFGTPQVGNVVHVKVWHIDNSTGLISPPMKAHATVVDTT